MNVLTAAWSSLDEGEGHAVVVSTSTAEEQHCARCTGIGPLVPVRSVVSKVFTGFDDWANPRGAGLCAVCAWGFSDKRLRAGPYMVTMSPATLTLLDRTGAGDRLVQGALRADHCLVVPLRPGRKHLLPTAAWGRVVVDDAHLPWSGRDAELLSLVVQLRGLGFGSRMIAEPAPPFSVLRSVESARWAWVLDAWSQLAEWRAPPSPWLALALHVSTPTKES